MANLTRETAKEYTLQHLTDLGYEDIVITGAIAIKIIGCPPQVTVGFTFCCDESESGVYRGSMDVWLEGGKLRGEW